MKWERTFEFSAPVDRVWAAFTDPDAPFRVMDPENAYQSRGAIKVDFTQIDSNQQLAWTETEGEYTWEMSVTFTEVETKTRITIVRSGFGDDDWSERGLGRLLGWEDVLADLEVFFRTGERLNRLYARRWGRLGLHVVEGDGGLRVMSAAPGSPSGNAGLEVGDVIVRIAGAPTVHMSDLWLLESALEEGADVDVEFVRGTTVQTSRMTIPDAVRA